MKVLVTLAAAALLLGTASLGAGIYLGERLASTSDDTGSQVAATAPATPVETPTPTATPTPLPPTPMPTPRSFADLQSRVTSTLASAGASGAVTLIELAGAQPQTWSFDGSQSYVAASTYKLPLLMEDAQEIAARQRSPNDQLCYESSDYEDGYFNDYDSGECFTRAELDRRAGTYSDNTAAHILVRYDGGTAALNAYARAHGATESAFYDPNNTTTDDLARLWQNEATGGAGGPAAQAYLYPLLTHTAYEQGIPAGVPAGTTVIHKIGILDAEVDDAALVESGPRGPYILAICTDGGGWPAVADIASDVSQFEAS